MRCQKEKITIYNVHNPMEIQELQNVCFHKKKTKLLRKKKKPIYQIQVLHLPRCPSNASYVQPI